MDVLQPAQVLQILVQCMDEKTLPIWMRMDEEALWIAEVLRKPELRKQVQNVLV